MSSDLRESVAAAERQMTVTATLVEDLRQELEALRSAVQSSNGSDEDDATELLFDEDAAAESPDGAITLDNDGWEDLRIATRYSFASPVEIKVNGTPALLQDLVSSRLRRAHVHIARMQPVGAHPPAKSAGGAVVRRRSRMGRFPTRGRNGSRRLPCRRPVHPGG